MSTPDNSAPSESSPVNETSAAPIPPRQPAKTGPITGSIVWGALVLIFCAFVASREMGSVIDPVAWMIATIIGVGVLLLGVGIVVLLRSSQERL